MSLRDKRRYFEELAAGWDRLPKAEDQGEKVRRFLEEAQAGQARRILDAGCGTGILAEGLLEICGPEARIVELDFAWGMVKENASKWEDGRLVRVCGEIGALPFRAGWFDLALCFNVVPHLGEPERALGPVLGALKPGGRLAIGHLMSSEQLNAFHAQLEGPVSGDRLLPVCEMAGLLEGMGAKVERSEEGPGWYFLRCRRPG